jgi:SAM-dependent methyltransferase
LQQSKKSYTAFGALSARPDHGILAQRIAGRCRQIMAEEQPLTKAYYDNLATYYKHMYADWEQSVKRQAVVLDGVIREFFGPEARTVLDAAAGIGTQSIGLAELGYDVTASGLSEVELKQAQLEAARRDLKLAFRVADMRQTWTVHQRPFDVVIACDNAVPHLLSDADILLAFEQFYQCAAPGGGCLISVRDYANMELGGKKLYPRVTHDTPDGRLVLFDLWEFDGDHYDMTTYIVTDTGGDTAQTRVIRGGRYYCVTIPPLERLLHQAGFGQVETLRDRFFQPLIVGVKV